MAGNGGFAAGYDRGGKWPAPTKVKILDALATSPGGDGVAFVVKIATRGSLADRAFALGSLARCPTSEAARDAILSHLDHRALGLRRAALRALKRFRSKAMILPLVERVERESDRTLRVDVLQFLVDLTGVNMGFVNSRVETRDLTQETLDLINEAFCTSYMMEDKQ